MTTAKCWSYCTGERGRNRVRVYEERPGGVLLVEFYERGADGVVRRKRSSLGHRDGQRAKVQADEIAAAFGRGQPPVGTDITLETLFDNYLREVTPHKSLGKQKHDKASAEMYKRFFGANRRARTLNRRDWDRFIWERRGGMIAPRRAKPGRSVGDRQVEYDLRFLMSVLNWATRAGTHTGEPLLDRNPLHGLPFPREDNPARPVLKQIQYQALLDVADRLGWRFAVALVLTHETGHRIGAVRLLRWSDVELENGIVRWRAEHDKIGFAHSTPLTNVAANALRRALRESGSIGDAWVFPSPRDAREPCSRHLMRDWWERAAELAELKPRKRLGWHSLRRKFATELKAAPLKDLSYLGGWKDPKTILMCYQQADEGTMRQALATRRAI